jgi:hypothetical protein
VRDDVVRRPGRCAEAIWAACGSGHTVKSLRSIRLLWKESRLGLAWSGRPSASMDNSRLLCGSEVIGAILEMN